MAMENYSLSDIAAVSESGLGGSGGIWLLIILFFLIGMGGNGFGSRYQDSALNTFATASSQNEILLGQKFDAISRQINQVGDGLSSSTYALNNAITTEGRALQSQLAECCCGTQRAIDGLNYNIATQSAAIQATDSANTQKILDAICQSKIDAMQSRINSLELAQATSGVVRYPTQSSWAMSGNPFCGCGNGF